MKRYVLDASVAAKWFVRDPSEELAEEADTLLAEYARARADLIVPDLFWPEIGSVLSKAARQGRLSNRLASKAISELLLQALETVSSRNLLQPAFEMATQFACSVYDCIYVALAFESDRTFITVDKRLVNALGADLPVRWLGAL
ncbi:MAG: type II toxin-antitoxin system VapC family toxin [Acidobacteriaceae bacterium]|nr:type II toxin-antitoxin system VapC family toxin [Acidobacteriaceae bacterium]